MPIVQGTQLSIDASSFISKDECRRALSHLDQISRYGIYQLTPSCTQEGYEKLEKINSSKIALLWEMIKTYISLSFHWIDKASCQNRQHQIQRILDKDFMTIHQMMQKVFEQPIEQRKGTRMLIKAYETLQHWQQMMEQTSTPYLQRHTYNYLETAWKQTHRFSKAELNEIKSMQAPDYFLHFELKQLMQQSNLQLIENWEKNHASDISKFSTLSLKIEEHYKSLVLKGSGEAAFLLAKHYDKKLKWKDSEEFMIKAAEHGHIPAQKELSFRYFGGTIYPQSQEKALIWLERLVQKKDCEALILAASIYSELGNKEKSLNYLRQAADLNDPIAIEILNSSSQEKDDNDTRTASHLQFTIPVNTPRRPIQTAHKTQSENLASLEETEKKRQTLLEAIAKRQPMNS